MPMAKSGDGDASGSAETAIQHRRWVNEMSEALLEFDPVKTMEIADEWIDKIEEFAVLYDWDDVAVQYFALSKLTAVGKNVNEYFYEKVLKCNRANMDDTETIQWVVRGLGNNRYRNYLGPLTKYHCPAEWLPYIIAASEFNIKDKSEHYNASSSENMNGQLSNNGNTTKSTTVFDVEQFVE